MCDARGCVEKPIREVVLWNGDGKIGLVRQLCATCHHLTNGSQNLIVRDPWGHWALYHGMELPWD